MFIYLFICLFVYLFICLFVYLFICLFVYLFIIFSEPCFSRDIPFQSVSSDDGTLQDYSNANFYQENQAWCTDYSYPNAYFQIDFGDLYVVCAVGIIGRYTGSTAADNTFTTKFKLAFAIANDEVWNFYEEPDGNDRVRKKGDQVSLLHKTTEALREHP